MQSSSDLGRSIVEEARKWTGTPFAHTGRTEAGVDCVGLLVRVGESLGLEVSDETVYPKETDGNILFRCLGDCCEPLSSIDEREVGDIVIFRRGRARWHAGILSQLSPLRMVHSWGGLVSARVRDELVGPEWLRSIHSVWRYRRAV